MPFPVIEQDENWGGGGVGPLPKEVMVFPTIVLSLRVGMMRQTERLPFQIDDELMAGLILVAAEA